MKKIIIIVGMTKDRVIGKDNELAWYIPEDLKLFKKITKNNVVVMGRKTFESIGKPLPKRINIVISKKDRNYEGVINVKSIEEAIKIAKKQDCDIFIIGGSAIYKQMLDISTDLYISFIDNNYEGNVYFPEINWENWELIETMEFNDFVHKKYKKKLI